MTTLLLRALAAAAVLVLSSPAWGAGKAPVAPDQAARSGAAEAQTLMRHGKFDEALAILLPLVRGETVDADAVFLYGLAALGASQKPGLAEKKRDALLDEAIGVFHTMLVQRPELVRVRLELGRAFFLKGEDGLAREHFEQVLAGKPPAQVVLNVNRFLGQIRARKRWTFRVGMALAPDSNIGAGSDERTIYIGGRPSLPPRPGGADQIGDRPLGLGGRRIRVPAGRALAAARGRRHLAPRIQARTSSTG